jgi:peroxiredoxin
MNRRSLNRSLLAVALWSAALIAALCMTAEAQNTNVEAKVGSPAPSFTATGSNGQTVSLDQLRGKYVVLEWHNQGCPFTRKHYTSGNMQALQKEWTAKGVEWFTVISSAPGQQGYVTASQENDYLAKMHAAPTAALLDPAGNLGRLYGAKTTPDMYVIDPQGKLIYSGAIDNRPTPDEEGIKGADNYVTDALTAALAGKSVATPYTRPYGCSVKYKD